MSEHGMVDVGSRFDLRTGRCMTEAETAVPVHDVRVVGGTVEIRLRDD